VADLPLTAWSGLAASLGAFNLPLADMRQASAAVGVDGAFDQSWPIVGERERDLDRFGELLTIGGAQGGRRASYAADQIGGSDAAAT
jgi:hypothetical protein